MDDNLIQPAKLFPHGEAALKGTNVASLWNAGLLRVHVALGMVRHSSITKMATLYRWVPNPADH